MSATTTKILEDALQLPEADRADLAACLFASLKSDMVLDADWQAEISRRIDAIDSGTAKLVPWKQARKRIFGDG